MIDVMKAAAGTEAPTILFGAFDRHNFGDLLFPHIAAAMLPQANLVFAGLAERDLRQHGGHRVRALAGLARELGNSPVNIIHVGGEILACDAWQAAVMLSPPGQVQELVARYDTRPAERLAWAREMLGVAALAPYAVSREIFPRAGRILYNAVGGVDLDARAPSLRAEVFAKLQSADAVSVRDRRTLGHLEAQGVAASLVPDPAVMVAELFRTQIRQHGQRGEPAEIRRAFPQGYLAVQFSADFGDDATLSAIATQLDRISAASGHGIVLFRAGAAPWHDDPVCYQRLVTRMRATVKIFHSLVVWDICALIASSKAFCGSSLHGGIVAGAFALPHLYLLHPDQAGRPAKQTAYAETWKAPGLPVPVTVENMTEGTLLALAAERGQLEASAAVTAARYRQAFADLRCCL